MSVNRTMKLSYPFEPILVRNRLGKGMRLLVCPFSLSPDHVCTLVTLPEGVHASTLSKNADYIVAHLRERFRRKVKNFSMIELRLNEHGQEEWYSWSFKWVSDTPLEPKSQKLSDQQRTYYQTLIANFTQDSQPALATQSL